MTRGVEDEINQHRYNTILCNTDEDPEREEDYLRLLVAQQTDGLIIAPTGLPSEPLVQLSKGGTPIVLLDRASPGVDAPLIGVANEDGAYQATRHLI